MGLALRLSASLASFARPMPAPAALAVVLRVASGARRVNAAGCALIESFEGRARRGADGLIYPYYDHLGYPTQGVGRLLSREAHADLARWAPIDDATCDAWLREDLDKFAIGVTRLAPVPLNDNEFAALVSLWFNCGLGNFQASTLRRMLLRGDARAEIAQQFLRWDKAGGVKSNGLARRRRAELVLFLSGGFG